MSYAAQNSGANGLEFFELLAEYYDLGGIYIEASPIYQTLDRSISITGSYDDATYDYDYSYSLTLPQLVRESMNTNISSISPMVKNGVFVNNLALSADLAEIGTPNTGKMYVGLTPGIASSGPFRHYSPLYQTFEMTGALYDETSVVVGTRTKKSDSTTTDLTANITLYAPYFLNAAASFRGLPDELAFQATNIGVETIDITAYTVAQWRDFRGTYNFTDTDSNGIVTTVEWILG